MQHDSLLWLALKITYLLTYLFTTCTWCTSGSHSTRNSNPKAYSSRHERLTASGMSAKRGYRWSICVIVGDFLVIQLRLSLRVASISASNSSLLLTVGRLSRSLASESSVSCSGSVLTLQIQLTDKGFHLYNAGKFCNLCHYNEKRTFPQFHFISIVISVSIFSKPLTKSPHNTLSIEH